MKKIAGLIFALFVTLTNMNAMSYEEARDRARFLTDKMAYELNLNDAQYNDAYEINLDYLMNIRTASDVSGVYLQYRNADLRYILYDWQYSLFLAADYFLRPVVWRASGWYLPVFGIYPVTRFYYNPPTVYHVYRGGHCCYHSGHAVSFYANRRPVWNGGFRGEHRGPVAGRPEAPRGHRNGFRFEPVGKRPDNDRGTGTRTPMPSRTGRTTTTTNRSTVTTGNRTTTTGGRTTTTTGRTTATGSRTTGRNTAGTTTSRTIPVRSTTPTTTRSMGRTTGYNRPSSTRTTVNRTSQSTQVRTTRPQSTPSVQRGATRSTTTRSAGAAQRSGAPSRSR